MAMQVIPGLFSSAVQATSYLDVGWMERAVKCTGNCRCGKHDRHDRIPPPPNTTMIPGRRAFGTTYGAEQRDRVQRTYDERKAKGIDWRDTPSERFDWDYALDLFRKTLAEVYG